MRSGSIGTAVLVTVMATAAISDGTVAGAIHKVNVSFMVVGCISVVGLMLSFWVRLTRSTL